jgi:hypothetical protein
MTGKKKKNIILPSYKGLRKNGIQINLAQAYNYSSKYKIKCRGMNATIKI